MNAQITSKKEESIDEKMVDEIITVRKVIGSQERFATLNYERACCPS